MAYPTTSTQTATYQYTIPSSGDILVVTVTVRTASSGSYAEASNLTLFKVPA